MKRLYLVRHGKSDWSIPGQPDFDRILNQRGLADVPNMANRFKNNKLPQQIHHSSAVRTSQTAFLIAKVFQLNDNNIFAHNDLYEAGTSEYQYLRIIRSLPDSINTAMFVGHNPTITFLAGYLGDKAITHMPTAAVASLQFDSSWKTIEVQSGKLLWFDYPKNEHIPVYL